MKTYFSSAFARFTLHALLVLPVGALWAQTTEISNLPLVGASTGGAPPNIMLLLDTSNSMSWTHMPDQLETVGSKQSIGYKSSECNALYYNRNRVYTIPKDSANAALPTPSFTNAPYNYYLNPTVKVDLSSKFAAHDSSTVQNSVTALPDNYNPVTQTYGQPAYYYYFVPTNPASPPTYSYNTAPCNAADTFAAGTTGNVASTGGRWYRVVVNSSSGPGNADERQNFAIWYTYYRTRINLAKSSIGLAFQSLSNTYRVGFLTVNPTLDATNSPTSSVQSSHYTPLSDFNSSQRSAWYTKFYGQVPGGSSPAREGLARVGRHYAGKTDGINTGMNTDPVQYACQKNFTIMTTDGYWNTAGEKPGLSGGPTNIDGTAWVGQQDGGADHPRTPDTDPNGLVPAGVFDGTLAQLPYTKTGTLNTVYGYPSCNLTVPGYATTTVKRTVTRKVQTIVTSPVNNAIQKQQRTVSFSSSSYKVTKQTLQYVIPTQTQTTTQFVWYNPAQEVSQPVLSCSGLTNCGPSALTGTVTVASGSCSPSDPVSPNYIRVVCSGATSAIQTSACTVGVNGCQTNTIFAAAFVAANTCSAGNSGSPNYYITTCTTNAPSTASPTTTASSAVVTSPLGSCTTSYSASGNVVCSYASTGAWSNVGSCSPAAFATSARECQDVAYCNAALPGAQCTTTTQTTDPSSCTVGTVTAGNVTTTCSYLASTDVVTNAVDPASCPIGTTFTNVAANGSNPANYSRTVCQAVTSAVVAGTCNPGPATSANGWVATSCGTTTVTGWYPNSQSTRNEIWTYDNGTVVPQTPVVSAAVALGSCRALPVVVTNTNTSVPIAPVYVPYSATGGSTNSLADVAQYYYATDLRPSMANIVPPTGSGPLDDRATWQHMSTYVVGLGVSGTLPYKADYATSGTGSFANIRALSQSWPVWPDTSINYVGNDTAWNSPKSIDDFWHTAVNGRGKYFSATDPDSVVNGIQSALQAINASVGSSTSNTISDQINITSTGLNFGSIYTTVEWVGDVRAFDSSDATTIIWSAQQKLDAMTQADCDNRKIYVRDSSTLTKLAPFALNTKKCSDNSVSNGLNSTLQNLLSATPTTESLTQYATMSAGQRTQATISSLVNYLRGQRQNEGFAVGQSGKLYRSRTHVLGDIVNSKPQFVGAPYAEYADDGYYSFKTDNATRQNMIYVGGNDGMLHAFYAPPSTASSSQLAKQGQEAWAYIPTKVISNLSQLADVSYSSNHRFYVDGTPRVGDVKFADGSWHTILVGGLGAGGKGYYALDITNPETPRSLWELDSDNCARTGCKVGYTFGQPVIGKMADGTWAVFMTSGYNNVDGGAGGQAALFIVNAETGASIKTINAGAASTGSPLGLAPISGWADRPRVDQTINRIYGGDLYGNMWRFNVNSADLDSVYRIGVAKDSDGKRQPITMPPELGTVGPDAYAYYGTGRLLGSSDFANTQQQTVYAVHDTLALADTSSELRSILTPYTTTDSLTIACAADCTTVSDSGFLIDLAGSGEKVITPLALIGNTLAIITTQPQDNTCGSGGTSKIYFANALNGKTVGTGYNFLTPVVGVIYLNGAGGSVIFQVKIPGSSVPTSGTGTGTGTTGTGAGITTTGSGGGVIGQGVVPTDNADPGTTRASWREIIQR